MSLTTIAVSKTVKRELEELKDKYLDEKGKMSFNDLLVLAWPRCPHCGARLVQKLASSRLLCLSCGKEYEIRDL